MKANAEVLTSTSDHYTRIVAGFFFSFPTLSNTSKTHTHTHCDYLNLQEKTHNPKQQQTFNCWDFPRYLQQDNLCVHFLGAKTRTNVIQLTLKAWICNNLFKVPSEIWTGPKSWHPVWMCKGQLGLSPCKVQRPQAKFKDLSLSKSNCYRFCMVGCTMKTCNNHVMYEPNNIRTT